MYTVWTAQTADILILIISFALDTETKVHAPRGAAGGFGSLRNTMKTIPRCHRSSAVHYKVQISLGVTYFAAAASPLMVSFALEAQKRTFMLHGVLQAASGASIAPQKKFSDDTMHQMTTAFGIYTL